MSSHLGLESDLALGLREALMAVARFVRRSVDVYSTCTVKLVSSALNALKLESRSIVEGLLFTKRSGTACSFNPDPPVRSLDPS